MWAAMYFYDERILRIQRMCEMSFPERTTLKDRIVLRNVGPAALGRGTVVKEGSGDRLVVVPCRNPRLKILLGYGSCGRSAGSASINQGAGGHSHAAGQIEKPLAMADAAHNHRRGDTYRRGTHNRSVRQRINATGARRQSDPPWR
jgi:hypothetical protein